MNEDPLTRLEREVAVLAHSVTKIEDAILKIAEHNELIIQMNVRVDRLESDVNMAYQNLREMRTFMLKAGAGLIIALQGAGIGVDVLMKSVGG